MSGENTVDVFRYLDHRAFLKDRCEMEKKVTPSFSHRYFSHKIGVRSPGHLRRVMIGERKLTPAMAIRYAEALKLVGEESDYFRALVSFNNAESNREREEAFARLSRFRKYREIHVLDSAQGGYCAEWYIPVVQELASCRGFQADPGWVAEKVVPRISVHDAQIALATLLEIGLLERSEDGRIRQCHMATTSGDQPDWAHIVRYHRQVMELASDALDRFPPNEREMNTVTLTVPSTGVAEIKDRIAKFQAQLMTDFAIPQEGTQVVQVNVQMFPVSTLTDD